MQLRGYQTDLVDRARASYAAGFRAPLIVAPTGAGKTIIFSHIAGATSSRSKRVIILVHRIELVKQTVEKLLWSGLRVGVIHRDYKPYYSANIQVASVQTLVKRMHKMPFSTADLIIVDEAHHATAGSWDKVINFYSGARVLGVTATPQRADGAGLDRVFDDLIIGPSVAELIGWGNLVQPIVYAPANKIDLSTVKISMGDYDQKELAIAVDKPSITGDAVAHYRKFCAYVPAVAFCVSVEHAEHVAEEFRRGGFNFHSVDGSMSDDIRAALLNGLSGSSTTEELAVLERYGITGTIHGLTSCAIISEGTDIPAIGCAILLRPTESLSLYIQQVGRALRPFFGRTQAIILDHAGNCYIHGMPDEDRGWTLEGVKRRKKGDVEKKIRVKQCDSCYNIHPPAPVCPMCGYIYPLQSREIEEVAGDLTAVTPEMRKVIQRMKAQEVAAARDLSELVKIGIERGYSPGWANKVHQARNKKVTGF